MHFLKIHLNELGTIYPYRRIGIRSAYSGLWWSFEKLMLLLGLMRLDAIYCRAIDLLPGVRKLSPDERSLAATIFRGSLPLDRIRIREGTNWGTDRGKIVYCSFYIINSYHMLDRQTLIHELVHVWQYRRYGVSYIPRALAAQLTTEGYDYGGLPTMRKMIADEVELKDLNYEQQASLIEDFYAHLYLNKKMLQGIGSGELWEMDKVLHKFFLDIQFRENEFPESL